MPLYRRQGSPFIWIRGSVAGEPYRLSSGTDDSQKAEEFERTHRDRLWRRHKLDDRGAVSFQDAVKRCLRETTKRSKDQSKAIFDWFLAVPGLGNAALRDISSDVIGELRETLQAQGRAQSTVDRYMAELRILLNHARDTWDYLDKVPKVPMFNPERPEPRWLTPEEFQRLYAALLTTAPHLARAARFAVNTGLRMRAQLSLKWSQVNWVGRSAWVGKASMKGKKTHAFPLNDAALEVLEELQALKDSREHVFSYQGHPIGDCNSRAYTKALERAGIEGANWHTLRHTFASWFIQSGGTPQELMALGPWASYEMVLRYAHLAPLKPAEAVLRLGQIGHIASQAQVPKTL